MDLKSKIVLFFLVLIFGISMTIEIDNVESLTCSLWENIPEQNSNWNGRVVSLVNQPTKAIEAGIPTGNYSLKDREVSQLCCKGDEVRELREVHSKNGDGWWKTLWKKHKTAIIVTTAVIVTVVVVVVVVATAGTTAAAGTLVTGAIGAGKAAASNDDDLLSNAPPTPNFQSGPSPNISTPSLPNTQPLMTNDPRILPSINQPDPHPYYRDSSSKTDLASEVPRTPNNL